MSGDVVDGQAQAVRSVVTPDELGHLGELSPIGRRPTSRDRTDEPRPWPRPVSGGRGRPGPGRG